MPENRRRVLVTESIHEVGLDILARQVEVINLPDRPGETLDDHLPHVDGVIVRITRIGAEQLARAPRLRVIGKHGVGVDNIDVAAAKERGITVISTPGTNDESVAEYTIMALLMLARQIETAARGMRAGRFNDIRRTLRGVDLRGKTLGLIGLGRIGARVAGICRDSFAMRVLGFDPYLTTERAAALGVDRCGDLAAMLPECDFVSLHVPLTTATRGIIGARELGLMKDGAYLINCARGGLVDESALAEALQSGKLAGAAVDVFEEEPTPTDHPLLAFDNVIPTPHIAGQTEDSLRRMATLAAEEVLRVLRGEAPHHPVG